MNGVRRCLQLAKRYVLLELKLYAALVRWCLGHRDVPAGAEPWGYAQLVTPVLWLWVFGSTVELVVLHLIVPWEGVRLVLDVISAWGLLWVLGLLAAYRTRPHLLLATELRLRNSVGHDIAVPLRAIGSASAQVMALPSTVRSLQVATDEQGTHVSLAVGGETNVVLSLRAPTEIETAKGRLIVDTVRLYVDEPAQLARELNETSRAQGGPAKHSGGAAV